MKFLLDTNIFSEIGKRHRAHPNVVAWVARTDVRAMATSVVVLAEIRRGIELKRRVDPRQATVLDRWYARTRRNLADRVFPIDEAISQVWAHMCVPNPLPVIDGLLAATAKIRGLILVTRNTIDVAGRGVSIFNPFDSQLD